MGSFIVILYTNVKNPSAGMQTMNFKSIIIGKSILRKYIMYTVPFNYCLLGLTIK